MLFGQYLYVHHDFSVRLYDSVLLFRSYSRWFHRMYGVNSVVWWDILQTYPIWELLSAHWQFLFDSSTTTTTKKQARNHHRLSFCWMNKLTLFGNVPVCVWHFRVIAMNASYDICNAYDIFIILSGQYVTCMTVSEMKKKFIEHTDRHEKNQKVCPIYIFE